MGLNLNMLYGAVIGLSVVGMILGITMTILGKLASTSGITDTAAGKVNDTVTELGGFVTWFGIIVIAVAGGIVFTLVLKAFQNR